MKKASTIALAVALTLGASGAAMAENWKNTAGNVWKNSAGECWQTGYWTPATAHLSCGGKAVVKQPVAPVAPVAKKSITAEKITFNANTFFDFDQATLKAQGKKVLDDVATQVAQFNLESVIAVGHTDSVGDDTYNQRLSERRATAVKAYLVARGVPADQIIASGRGETQPVASNASVEGRVKNRRVEIEIVGSK